MMIKKKIEMVLLKLKVLISRPQH